MMRFDRISKVLPVILALTQLFPITHLGAIGKNESSVVVLPVRDGHGDDESKLAADLIRKNLSSSSILHIVEPDKVESVLNYHEIGQDGAIDGPATALLAKAKDSYYNSNYVEAQSLAKKVITDLTANADTVADHGRLLVDAYITQAVVLKAANDLAGARESIHSALKIDPTMRLDRSLYPPSMINLLEHVRDEIPTAKTELLIESNPSVAEIYINGIIKGVTPLTINDLPPNDYYIKFVANKYGSVTKKITLVTEIKTKIKENLRWQGKITAQQNNYKPADVLKIADLLKVDKVVTVNANQAANNSTIKIQVVDRRFNAAHHPVTFKLKNGVERSDETIQRIANDIKTEIYADISKNPTKYVDQESNVDPALLGGKQRSKISKPVLFGVLGGVLAAGLAAGLAAAFAGGSHDSSGNSGTGSVNVTFE